MLEAWLKPHHAQNVIFTDGGEMDGPTALPEERAAMLSLAEGDENGALSEAAPEGALARASQPPER